MKILVIGENSAIPQRLYSELAQHATVDWLIDSDDTKNLTDKGFNKIYALPLTPNQRKYYRRLYRGWGIIAVAQWWSYKASKIVDKDYDAIVAIISSPCILPLVCGSRLSKQFNCKLAVYTVDAIPGPGGWASRSWYHKQLRVMKKYLPSAHYLAAASRQMLQFQLTTFKHKEGLRSNVLHTPSTNESYQLPIAQENIFLFTGSIYGMRSPINLFKAFQMLLKEKPDARIVFVGEMLYLDSMKKILTEEECKQIDIEPYTSNLEPYYRRAKVLLDIDANLDEDPFLSSKITNYIKANRIILCETGRKTPSREIFAGYKTIIQCDHSVDSIYNGMIQALELAATEQDYSEREPLIEMFSTPHVCSILWNDLQEICSTTQQ